jgi:hypothetical protein
LLYSPAGQIAFSHYPKTAGTSLTAWFRAACPDAAHVEPGNCHMDVRTSLEHLGLITARSSRPKLVRECLRIVKQMAPGLSWGTTRCDVKIIGVVREPFDMLVSLYEYWRRYEFRAEPAMELIRIARTGTFRQFLKRAVGERQLSNYHTYFDVGGPAWSTTRLLDFHSLEPALAEVCHEFGIEAPAFLSRANAAPGRRRDVGGYLAEAGGLVFDVRNHFRWYYEEATRIMIRGRKTATRRAV